MRLEQAVMSGRLHSRFEYGAYLDIELNNSNLVNWGHNWISKNAFFIKFEVKQNVTTPEARRK